MLFVYYPKCSTCVKAKKWLDANGIAYEARQIQEQPPTQAELELWVPKSGLPLKKFFNTCGQAYRSMGLKDKLSGMDEASQIALLASDGMLVKRPILVTEDAVLVGFKEADWAEALL